MFPVNKAVFCVLVFSHALCYTNTHTQNQHYTSSTFHSTNIEQDDQLHVSGKNRSRTANYAGNQERSRSEDLLHTDHSGLDQYHFHHHHHHIDPDGALLQQVSRVRPTACSTYRLSSAVGVGEMDGVPPPPPPPIPPLPINYQRSDGEIRGLFVFETFYQKTNSRYVIYQSWADESCSANESREHRKQRAHSKATRQAELKRYVLSRRRYRVFHVHWTFDLI